MSKKFIIYLNKNKFPYFIKEKLICFKHVEKKKMFNNEI